MKLRSRIGLILAGLALVAYGAAKYRQYGVFPYLNYYMHVVYPLAVVVTGVVFCGLAFLPSGSWVYRLISTKRSRSAHVLHELDLYAEHHQHGSGEHTRPEK